ncbi:MAG: hypothetical protein H7Y38_17020 [Armatimonadetes bacterium]|nr:hypothetical protein [Armatimonadota bacterium]
MNSVEKQIDRILWEVWDPIGVNDIPDLAGGEYRDYVPRIYDALMRGASDDTLWLILQAIEKGEMNLSSRNKHGAGRQATIAALRTIALPKRER